MADPVEQGSHPPPANLAFGPPGVALGRRGEHPPSLHPLSQVGAVNVVAGGAV